MYAECNVEVAKERLGIRFEKGIINHLDKNISERNYKNFSDYFNVVTNIYSK